MQQERAVIEHFGLRDAYVVPAPMADETLNDSLARAASMYVSQHIEDGAFVNMIVSFRLALGPVSVFCSIR